MTAYRLHVFSMHSQGLTYMCKVGRAKALFSQMESVVMSSPHPRAKACDTCLVFG